MKNNIPEVTYNYWWSCFDATVVEIAHIETQTLEKGKLFVTKIKILSKSYHNFKFCTVNFTSSFDATCTFGGILAIRCFTSLK